MTLGFKNIRFNSLQFCANIIIFLDKHVKRVYHVGEVKNMETFNTKQVAERLGVNVFMVRRWIQSGKLSARKKNPLSSADNSPYLISAADLAKLEKQIKHEKVK